MLALQLLVDFAWSLRINEKVAIDWSRLVNIASIGNSLKKPRSINFNGVVRGAVSNTDKLDFYRFTLTARSSFTAAMSQLKANAALSLLSKSGQSLLQARNPGKQQKLINTTLDAGIYFLRVSRRSSDTRYRLVLNSVVAVETEKPDSNSNTSPDLKGSSFVMPASITIGSNFSVSFSVQNIGSADAKPAHIAFYLSNDRAITSGDRLLGTYDISSLTPGSGSGLLSTTLTLPAASSNFLWNSNSTHYIGMVIDPGNSILESSEINNSNTGIGVDFTAVAIDGIPAQKPFNIQFDYRFDTNNWFTPERRATLEAAASIWENIILDDFADIPIGTTLNVLNPQPTFATPTSYTRTSSYLASDAVIDDLLIFVGAGDVGNVTLGQGGAALFYESGTSLGASLNNRYSGNDFEPWTGSILFTTGVNWFFDQTPNTADDVPSSQYDFLSTALHEIGHILGFESSLNAFSQFVVNNTFSGSNAKAVNRNNPIPLFADNSHIQPGYRFDSSGELLMEPATSSGTRVLPTVLDIAVLDDIGYTVNYNAASQNSPV